jgi:lactate dehydrogenase-like 2-hydroxyacid dehydrogenase
MSLPHKVHLYGETVKSHLMKFLFNILLCFIFQSIYYTIFGWPAKDLNNEICVVTGGGGGLGRLLAMRLSRLGVKVILWDISQEGEKKEPKKNSSPAELNVTFASR